jgi:hypothetical protein
MLRTLAPLLLATIAQAAIGDKADILLLGDSFLGLTGRGASDTSVGTTCTAADRVTNYVQRWCAGTVVENRA